MDRRGRPVLAVPLGARLNPTQPRWPRERVEAELARRGAPAVVADCVALIRGDDVDETFVVTLGGPGAVGVLASGPSRTQAYWLRVWGLRALLYVWDADAPGGALDAVIDAFDDPAWRVREMAAKVVARQRLDDALDGVARLSSDSVPRVRAAAARALVRLTS